jgi:hypothetical protein
MAEKLHGELKTTNNKLVEELESSEAKLADVIKKQTSVEAVHEGLNALKT